MRRIGYEFTLDELIARVRELVAEHPTTRYEKPRDGDTGSAYAASYKQGVSRNDSSMPGCLFGQILPLNWVERDLSIGISTLIREPGADWKISDTVRIDPLNQTPSTADKIDWLSSVQGSQDRGESWSIAVEKADIAYPSVSHIGT